MKSVITLLFILLFTLSPRAMAQKYGDIPASDYNLKHINGYPGLNAAVLFNVAEITFTQNFELVIFYHKRIKVLTEAGKEVASMEIPYLNENKVVDIKAASFNADGKRTDLNTDNVFDQGNSRYRKKVFAVPGVEVGSIIELQYERHSKYISNLEPWYFQEKYYVRRSQVSVLLPAGFTYRYLLENLAPSDLSEYTEKVIDPYKPGFEQKRFYWAAHDLPPVRQEPFMRSPRDYQAKMLFQILSYDDELNSLRFSKTWGQVTKPFWQKYDPYIEDNGLEPQMKSLVDENTTPEEKIRTLYSVCP